MTKRKVKILAFVFAGVMLFALASCKKNETPDPRPTPTEVELPIVR